MTIIATYCSRKKAHADKILVRALARYLGSHINEVTRINVEEQLPLYFLSGAYGLIDANHLVMWYDVYLSPNDVPARCVDVATKLITLGVTDVRWYTEATEATAPYDETMRRAVLACRARGVVVSLHEHVLTPKDVLG